MTGNDARLATVGWKRTPTVGEWTILLAPAFTTIDNGDSWQAYSGDRIIYVSSLRVDDEDGQRTPATALRGAAARTFTDANLHKLSHQRGAVCGDAEIRPDGTVWRLRGYMCADGVVATCLVDYPRQEDEAWAVATWESLEHP